MTEKPVTQKISEGEVAQNSLSKDEIDKLSDIISDGTGNESPDDTGSFRRKEDDTGEFEPIKDSG
jgi:hypothetical protein